MSEDTEINLPFGLGKDKKLEIIYKAIDEIEYDDTDINSDIVAELSKSIRSVGILHPLVVNTKNRLVSGRHRLMSAKDLGMKEVPVVQMNFEKAERRQLATLDENLTRGVYTELQKSRMYAKKKILLQELGEASKAGGKRSKNRKSDLASATDQISKQTGESKSTINEYTQIGEGIPSHLDEQINKLDLKDKKMKLLELAKAKDQKKWLAEYESKKPKKLPRSPKNPKGKDKSPKEVCEGFSEHILSIDEGIKNLTEKMKTAGASGKTSYSKHMSKIENALITLSENISALRTSVGGTK